MTEPIKFRLWQTVTMQQRIKSTWIGMVKRINTSDILNYRLVITSPFVYTTPGIISPTTFELLVDQKVRNVYSYHLRINKRGKRYFTKNKVQHIVKE